MDSQFDRIYDELMEGLFDGDLTLGLFVEDDYLMPLFVAAYVGEMGLQGERAEADRALSEELEETFTRILERLERDELPLV